MNKNTYTLICDFEDLKELGFIDDNMDERKSNILIKNIQDMYIQSALSTQLYEELLEQINNNNILDQYRYLIDEFIIFAIGYYIKAQLTIDKTIQLRNNGATKSVNENYDYATLSEIKFLVAQDQDKAEWYCERLTKYLNTNKVKYPEFNIIIEEGFDKPAEKSGFSLGIMAGKKYK